MISRRTLLKELGAGSAMLAMPAFLAACAPKHMRQDPLPTDPFGAWFGVDPLSTRLVLEELSQHGADWAELYFQHSRSTSLSLEDGIVSQASSRIDQGVGLRVVVGDHTGYAFTEDLSLIPPAFNPLELAVNSSFLLEANLRMYLDNGASDPSGNNQELFSSRLTARGIA
ncbi:MAG TPA: DNA gyrase modulator, partial [Myxococcota bacterium]|nr:DNA gyrase modulator [Myxococcota bacterium]